MTGAFKATYVFGYIVAAMFVIFFLVLVAAPSEFVGKCTAVPCTLVSKAVCRTLYAPAINSMSDIQRSSAAAHNLHIHSTCV